MADLLPGERWLRPDERRVVLGELSDVYGWPRRALQDIHLRADSDWVYAITGDHRRQVQIAITSLGGVGRG